MNLEYRIQKQIERFGSLVYIKRFNKEGTSINPIYKESKKKAYYPPIDLPAVVIYSPGEETITELGMDKNRTEIIAKVPVGSLISKGLVIKEQNNLLLITQDDIITVDGIDYNITSIKPVAQYKIHQIYAIGGLRE